jgi:uncharacterized protein YcbX
MFTDHVPHTGDGSVVALWRYPVKSMLGEELNASAVTQRGMLGDRAYALVDRADGKVASAKNPRKWPQLFDCRAALSNRRTHGRGGQSQARDSRAAARVGPAADMRFVTMGTLQRQPRSEETCRSLVN